MNEQRTGWAAESDVARFTRIYTECYDRVLAYTVARAPQAVAADAAAETFLVAWRRLKDVPDQPLPWLLVVARNTMSGQRRSAFRSAVLADEVARLTGLASDGGDVADAVTERITVLAALGGLSPPDREALMLRVWDGLSARDAAAVTGCSPAAFTVRLHRARLRLSRALDAATDHPDPPPRPAAPRPSAVPAAVTLEETR